MVDPFMRTKGHLDIPWLGDSPCGIMCVCEGAFRKEKTSEVPVMVVAEQRCFCEC